MLKKNAALSLTVSLLISLFTVLPATAEEFNIMLFQGIWTGKWVSDAPKHDNAPVHAAFAPDTETNTVTVVMFQTPEPPAPPHSSMSIGKFENGKILIDAPSSDIGTLDNSTEMMFWLVNPLLIRGTYKNKYDSGTFEFKRTSKEGA